MTLVRAEGVLGKSPQDKEVCSMLFPRCIHRRLCVLLHEFHTTRPYLRKSLDAFQIDPITAHVIMSPKPSPPGRPQFKTDSRKTKTLRAGKQRKKKSDRTECFPDSGKLSSRLWLSYGRVRRPRTVGGAGVMRPHQRSSLLVSCGADGGVIRPRASGGPFLEGELLFVAADNIPQLFRRIATISAESCSNSSTWPRSCTFPVRILETEYILECSLEASQARSSVAARSQIRRVQLHNLAGTNYPSEKICVRTSPVFCA
jgi:hypothetical protein